MHCLEVISSEKSVNWSEHISFQNWYIRFAHVFPAIVVMYLSMY